MSTPKTPFRSRRSSSSAGRSAPAVRGVVSQEEDYEPQDDSSMSQATPQPSPYAPPVPQTRFSDRHAHRDDDFSSVAERSQTSVLSLLPEIPPSPYSPPPASLWSEHTEDQWPYNHTKRDFGLPRRSEASHRRAGPAVTQPVSSMRHSSNGRRSTSLLSVPPLEEVRLPRTQERQPTPARPTTMTSPYYSAQSTVVPEDPGSPDNHHHNDDAVFLLQEENKALRAECVHLQDSWRAHCDELQQGSVEDRAAWMARAEAQLADLEAAAAAAQEEHGHYRSEQETAVNQLSQEKDDLIKEYIELTSQYEALLMEKETLQSALDEFQKSEADRQLGNEDLEKEKQVLEGQRERLQTKLDQFETEVVNQSKQIFQLEEALGRAKELAAKEIEGVQSEFLARGKTWQAEKQALEQEVQKLRRTVTEKDRETAEIMEQQQRQQAGQIRDLEHQLLSLTNTLAEWQGRHSELRSTVDQHLQFRHGTSIVTESTACQTEPSPGTTTNPTPTRTPTNASMAFPDTPSVRFEQPDNTPMVSTTSSPPLSFASVPPTPRPELVVSPWIPAYQGRSLHVRADPPPSFTPQSSRSISPAASYQSVTPSGFSRRADSIMFEDALLDQIEEEPAEDVQVVDRVPSARKKTPQTVLASNLGKPAERKDAVEKVKDELAEAMEERLRLIMAYESATAASDIQRERRARTRESLESTIADLRQQLEGRKEEAPVTSSWPQETSELLDEIQRECNAVFERGKQRRTSPRTVLLQPIHPETFLDDFLEEDIWETQHGDTYDDNATTSPLSVPDFDKSLNETEAMVRGLLGSDYS